MVPTLIYDGRCGFCKMWVNYWRRLTNGEIFFAPSQDVGAQYPQISDEDFKRTVWLVYPHGELFRGAEAVFRVIAAAGKLWPLRAYQNIPGFAGVTEGAYFFIAAHRSLFYWITRILWGRDLQPSSYHWTRAVLLRGVGLVYLLAFASMLPQMLGLVGSQGILPVKDYLDSIQSQIGGFRSYYAFPTLAWLDHSDVFLRGMCWAGVALAMAVLLRIFPSAALMGLYLLYLSIDTIGQTFLSFQWDALLLETGFAVLLIAPAGLRPRYSEAPPGIAIWVMRFLTFRLMLESGIVKLLSGDSTWRNLTALSFHYETQPLPTPLAWYAHHLPPGFHKASVVGVFLVEIGVPFLFFMPRRLRILAAWVTIIFQLLIAATGNYTVFNLLTIVLCFSLLDDQHLRHFVPTSLGRRLESGLRMPYREVRRPLAFVASTALMVMGVLQLLAMLELVPISRPVGFVLEQSQTYHIVNQYGLFAVMTTSRPEIVVEGSEDGEEWKAYEFKFKPGDVHRAPPWVAPYHPRLDWQMWFAALSNHRNNPWFTRFMIRLLEGSPDVVGLLGTNPFPAQPPRFVRAVVYDYHFSDPATRRSTGAWWTRQLLGAYFPAVSLR
jgi:lipase maturation factor 1